MALMRCPKCSGDLKRVQGSPYVCVQCGERWYYMLMWKRMLALRTLIRVSIDSD